MTMPTAKIKLNVAQFVGDFVRGLSDEELRERHRLDEVQLPRVVNVLRGRGNITSKEIEKRKENLGIRLGEGEQTGEKQRERLISVDLDTGLVLHCPSCGASVKRDAQRCDYCSAHLDFSLKGKTIHCAHCYQKIPADSRFCVVCGRPAQKKAEEGKVLEDRLCPRCQASMREQGVAGFTVLGCDQCQGMFIPHDTFQMMQDSSERVVEATGAVERAHVDTKAKISYVRCPVCKQLMNRKNFAQVSGVIIDVCMGHGLWFDSGEMEKIMDFIGQGGLKKAREADLEKEKELAKLEKYRREGIAADRGLASFGLGAPSVGSELDLLHVAGTIFNLFKK